MVGVMGSENALATWLMLAARDLRVPVGERNSGLRSAIKEVKNVDIEASSCLGAFAAWRCFAIDADCL